MKLRAWLSAFTALVVATMAASLPAQTIFDISCEGAESTGGGVRRYQYTVRNIDPTGAPQALQLFCFGTEDGNVAEYTNLVQPAGFTFAVVPNDGTICSVAFTTNTKTPHTVLPPVIGGSPSTFLCVFQGNLLLSPAGMPGDRATFGFDNRRCSWDVEWFGSGPGGGGQGQSVFPIAGPTGVFTNGFVHSPGYRFLMFIPTFCDASDGSLVFCPCGNVGRPDSGCDIAQATGGVSLEVLAQQTSPNAATITGIGYPTMGAPTAVVIRSPTLDPGTPVVFGDGLRCIGPTVVRLAASAAMNGCSFHTFGHSGMAGSGTFYYQLWFRNQPASFCDPSAAWNLSNGKRFTW